MQHFFLHVADPLFLSHWNVTKFLVTLIKLSFHLLAFLWCHMYFYGASSSGFPSLERLPASFPCNLFQSGTGFVCRRHFTQLIFVIQLFSQPVTICLAYCLENSCTFFPVVASFCLSLTASRGLSGLCHCFSCSSSSWIRFLMSSDMRCQAVTVHVDCYSCSTGFPKRSVSVTCTVSRALLILHINPNWTSHWRKTHCCV